MAACLRFGTRTDPTAPVTLPRPDWFGLVSGGLGAALIYAALDQGNRLDWLNSGLVLGLLAAGVVLVAGFLAHERLHPMPTVNLRIVFSGVLPRLLLLVAFLRLTILSTAYLIPQFLTTVRGFRAPEVGETLVWIAAPQFAVCALAGFLLRRFDARLVASGGFILIAVACLDVAHGLTAVWSSDQFAHSLLWQALGQSLALSGVVFYAVLHLDPKDALTFGGAIQTARLLGGEIGTALTATLVRVRGQIASNELGLHVQSGDPAVLQRLAPLRGRGRARRRPDRRQRPRPGGAGPDRAARRLHPGGDRLVRRDRRDDCAGAAADLPPPGRPAWPGLAPAAVRAALRERRLERPPGRCARRSAGAGRLHRRAELPRAHAAGRRRGAVDLAEARRGGDRDARRRIGGASTTTPPSTATNARPWRRTRTSPSPRPTSPPPARCSKRPAPASTPRRRCDRAPSTGAIRRPTRSSS